MTARVSLSVLVDNNTLIDRYFLGEPGLSILIETGDRRILFDTGYSDAFIRNAETMGIDLLDLDYVVLSHGHLDHTWGLVHLVQKLAGAEIHSLSHKKPVLVAHPYCFYPKPSPPLPNIGSLIPEEEAGRQFSLSLSAKPFWLTPDLVFLGEIPRRFGFEHTAPGKRRIVMPDGQVEQDQLLDDSALACRTPEGLVIITGCSHAGICNITEYAQEVCGERRIIDIIGGFHLLKPSPEQMKGTCTYLRDLALKAVHACHCTSLSSKIILAEFCPILETGVGTNIEW
ncbi:MBL fold metallo-hydrolase [Methanoregula sp.]|jgi:7,8-dihydropterin-6-yl-methyl-4-(beta-D-ribofuranosyl)aminobenzene 5'-phosphate synthase|uniref:MBL fold metallo-hydrolase n=1 Tax=Methanoregula sp. TaxID=2052170 RepID=UPI0025DBE33C|nr:MBL fold metallo-hydrolase [Methanoregula sp.]